MEENKPSWEFVVSPNYWSGRKIPCTVLVYHYTADGPIESCIKYFQQKDKTSAHFVIERSGRVVQMVKLEDRAWHAGESVWKGVSGVNNFSVGIEICNWGPLKKRGNDYFCWPNDYSQKFTGTEPFKDNKGDFWENYPEAQIKAVIDTSKFILNKFPTITLDNIIGHEDIAPGRKQDPGPAFPWEIVRYELGDLLKQKEYIPEAVSKKDDVKPAKQNEIKLDIPQKNNLTASKIINALIILFRGIIPKFKLPNKN